MILLSANDQHCLMHSLTLIVPWSVFPISRSETANQEIRTERWDQPQVASMIVASSQPMLSWTLQLPAGRPVQVQGG
eukprot:470377-Pyramimonas_sp.AAC.1